LRELGLIQWVRRLVRGSDTGWRAAQTSNAYCLFDALCLSPPRRILKICFTGRAACASQQRPATPIATPAEIAAAREALERRRRTVEAAMHATAAAHRDARRPLGGPLRLFRALGDASGATAWAGVAAKAATLPRLDVVRDAREQPAQLDRGRQFALLLECSADCSGFRFGHGEHAGSMVTRAVTGKLLDISLALPVLQHRVDTAPQLPEFLGEPARHQRAGASMSSCCWTSPRRKSVPTYLGRPSPGCGAAPSCAVVLPPMAIRVTPGLKAPTPEWPALRDGGRSTSGTEVGTRL